MIGTVSSLTKIDSFPYRHRLSEVMGRPVLTGMADLSLAQACDSMNAARVSSLIVVDTKGRAIGIVTERDVMRALSDYRADALDLRLERLMSSPVETVFGDDFLYLAIARMTRLGFRHLVVVDQGRRPIGMITGRALLKVRAGEALVLGDDVAQANTAEDLDRARRSLPGLARTLRADAMSAREIAGIVSSVLRDLTTRSAFLSEQAMLADGWGPAPAAWALLVLGSGGRGESLLAFDQDNAIVHAGMPTDDPWFAELGRRLNDILNLAGIPYCKGEVMARNPLWRRSLDDWKAEIRRWVFEPELKTIMNVDIFFDMVPVYGDAPLALELAEYAIETAATSAFFVQLLALNVAQMDVPLGVLGQLKTVAGRIDAKKCGLLPLVSAARAKAVRAAILATGTAERYAALQNAGMIHEDDLTTLLEAQETILGLVLDQQLADIAANRPPSTRIEPRKLPRLGQRRLKEALQRIQTLKQLIGGVMAG